MKLFSRIFILMFLGLTTVACNNTNSNAHSSDQQYVTSNVPEEVRKWRKQHIVPEKKIRERIKRAQKDSARLRRINSYDQMTIDALLIQQGKPDAMFEYGDTTSLDYYDPLGGALFIFVRDTLNSIIVD